MRTPTGPVRHPEDTVISEGFARLWPPVRGLDQREKTQRLLVAAGKI